jgi:hypothetical protein
LNLKAFSISGIDYACLSQGYTISGIYSDNHAVNMSINRLSGLTGAILIAVGGEQSREQDK